MIEPKIPQAIGVVEDPALGCSGPLWVRGGVTIESASGVPYEKRGAGHPLQVRRLQQHEAAFCNGSHASIKFRDGLVEFVRLKPKGKQDE